jgi:hypothetical protein
MRESWDRAVTLKGLFIEWPCTRAVIKFGQKKEAKTGGRQQ